MRAHTSSYPPRIRTLRGFFALVFAIAIVLAVGVPAAGAATSCLVPATDIVSPSCFEGGDGNLVVDDVFAQGNRIDWSTLMGLNPPPTQYQDPRNPNDDVFKASGADEQNPSGWELQIEKAPDKADILNTAFYTELVPQTPGHIFLYAGFESDAGGNVNVSFELNRGNPAGGLLFNNGKSLVPYRSENDLLVTYDGGVGNVKIGICYWHGTNLSGNWFTLPNGGGAGLGGNQKDCGATTAAQAIGNVNAADMPNPYLNLFSNPILLGNFGEMSIDLTTTIAAGQGSLCFRFGGVWMHSRSSSQANATMEDYILPTPINANSCSLSVDKTVAVSSDGALSPTTANSQAGLTYGDSKNANNGDTAYYRIAVANTGTQTITHDVAGLTPFGAADVADNRCGSPTIAAADKLHPVTGNQTAADATPTSFDGGDVWIFRCTRVYSANDAATFVNTASASGQVGATPVSDDDTATVTRIPPASLTVTKATAPASSGPDQFDFSTTGQAAYKLDTDGDNADGATTSNTFSYTSFGQKTIQESALPAGWNLTGIACPGATVDFSSDGTNFHPTYTAGDNRARVTLASGDNITCTFTNTKQASLTVTKATAPASSGADQFDFTTSGTAAYKLDTDGDNADGATTSQTVTYTSFGDKVIQESALPAGWSLTGISCPGATVSFSSDGNSYHGSFVAGDSYAKVSLVAGDSVTCTYSNTKQASLTVTKATAPASSGADQFDFTTSGTAAYKLDTDGDNADGATTSKTVTYSSFGDKVIQESQLPAGWNLTGISCPGATVSFSSDGNSYHGSFVAGDSYAKVSLVAGDSVTCTYSNTKQASLTVTKATAPASSGADQFDFTTTGQSNYKLDTDGDNADGATTSKTVTYTSFGDKVIQESQLPAGWNLTGISCPGATVSFSNDGNSYHGSFVAGDSYAKVTLAAGDVVTCTYSNTKQATLTVTKATAPASSGAGQFDFTTSGTAAYKLDTDGDNADGATTSKTVTYTSFGDKVIQESQLPADWDLTGISCPGATVSFSSDGNSYHGSFVAGDSYAKVSISAGDVVTCTYTNTKQAKLTVTKATAPASSGADQFDFTTSGSAAYKLDTDGDNADGATTSKTISYTSFGDKVIQESALPAGWNLTGISCPGATVSFSNDGNSYHGSFVAGDSYAKVSLVAGDSVTCTYSNTKQATLTVTKGTAPVSSGADQFDFTTTGQSNYKLDTDGDNADGATTSKTFNYTGFGDKVIRESALPADWDLTGISCPGATVSFSSDGNSYHGSFVAGDSYAKVSLVAGDVVSCRYTNTKQAKLTVTKATAPANSGADQFDFSTTGKTDYKLDTDGDNGDGATTSKAFSYTTFGDKVIRESALPAGWNLTGISCPGATVQFSSDANNFHAVFAFGDSYARVTLAAGDDVTCTYSNTNQATLVVAKATAPASSGASQFDFTTTGQSNYKLDTDGDNADGATTSKTFNYSSFGDKVIRESALPADWDLTGISCPGATVSFSSDGNSYHGAFAAGDSYAKVSLAAGDVVTCTYTNTKQAKLTVTKATAPASSGADQFDFTTSETAAYKLDTDGDNADGATTSKTVSYTGFGDKVIRESALPADWDLTGISCPGATVSFSSDGNSYHGAFAAGDSYAKVNLSAGEVVTCTYTNTKQATLTVTKGTAPVSSGADQFDFSTTGKTDYKLDTDGDDTDGAATSKAFSYTSFGDKVIRESALPADWDLTGISCPGATVSFSSDGNSYHGSFVAGDSYAKVSLVAGDVVSCRYTNTKQAKLTVTKATAPANSGADQFDFSTTGKTDYKLDTDGDNGDGATTSKTFSYTSFGDKVIQESQLPADWDLTGISCPGATVSFSSDGNSYHGAFAAGDSYAKVSISAGDVVTCTYTNTKQAKLTVTKATAPASSGADQFDFTTSGSAAYKLDTDGDNADGATTSKTISYSSFGDKVIQESALPAGWDLTGISCPGATVSFSNDGNSYHGAFVAGDSYAKVSLAAGDEVTCTYSNTKQATLTVTKATTPASSGADQFDFTTSGSAAYKLDTDGDNADGATTSKTVTYTSFGDKVVQESQLPANWDLTGISCPGATVDFSSDGNSYHGAFAAGDSYARVTLAAGDDVTCTYSNTKQAKLTVAKSTLPASSGADQFDFTTTGKSNYKLDTDGDDTDGAASSKTFNYTSFGDKVVQESQLPANWDLTGISCPGATVDFSSDGNSYHGAFVAGDSYARVTLAAGDDVTCTYANTKEALVKATKQVVSGKGGETFPLTVDGTTTTHRGDGDSTPEKAIVPGTTITVSEGAKDGGPAGTFATTVSCVDGQQGAVATSNENVAHTSIAVTPTAGQIITCTFVNTRRPDPPPPTPTTEPSKPNPKVSINKVGPATANAGDRVTYGIGVTNTGDQSFPEQNVVLTDALCEAPPALVGKLGDKTPGTLDPGETWGYSCTVQTLTGQPAVHNVASVDAATIQGTHVGASDPADTTLFQPEQAVEPLLPSAARLRGPASCLASRKVAQAVVTGRRIASVTFLIDGKAVKTVKASKAQTTQRFVLKLDARKFSFDKHRVTARVTFLSGSTLKSRTLRLSFSRCRIKSITPKFTG